MVTETAQQADSSQANPSFFTRTADQVRQFICGLHGHDALLHFERGKISLQCASCGHESPGWDVRASSQHQVPASAPRIVRIPLVREQRVA
jgi:hypothetical protein